MCGFVGWIDLRGEGRVSAELVREMADQLVHRGPDSAGCYLDANVALGFRRLKIIDLESGDQPMFNEDRSLVLLCNGEIYDYLDLRRDLAGRGHRLETQSDVEVLLHLYEESSAGFLGGLNGQFSFVLYDRREGRLLLARDHVGVNPLYYAEVDGLFLFASEIKALLVHPKVRREVDLTGLDQVFSFPGLVSPRTMFVGIASLRSGHYLSADANGVRLREYWDLDYPRLGELPYELSEGDYVEGLAERLERSVRRRLQADVPVGFYLSGGLDSSLIAALIHKVSPDAVRRSFSIGFTDESISETKYQRLMADFVGSQHQEIVFDWSQLAARMQRMIYHGECPVKETYNACSLAMSEAARQAGVTVVLSGEGADELFAGYVGYRFDRSGLRGQRGHGLEALLEAEMRGRLWGDPDLFYESDHVAFQEIKSALYSEALAECLPEFDCLGFELVNKERLRDRHPVHQRSYLDFKLRLSDHLISDHGDRMALANSVEGRYPFLDLDLVQFAVRVPPELKLNAISEKYIVKKVAEKLIPREIVEREKFGFHAPGSPYLLRQNIEWIEDMLSHDRIRRQGFFNPDTVDRLKARYLEDGFKLNLPFESDLLIVVLTFGIFLDAFALPGAGR
jgi:asparagine synthase (glutamine-hydrolysing)